MISILRSCLASFLLLFLAACGKQAHDHGSAGGHAHTAPHGGTLVELGEHAYNLEILRDAETGKLTIWILDGHAENFVRIKAASLTLVATVGAEKRPLLLTAVANSATGETVGDTSQFEAQADWLKSTPRFDVLITALEVRGTNFARTTFTFPKPTK